MLIKQFPDKDQLRILAGQSNVIPVCVEILADTETPVSLLRKIYNNKGPVFLFESVEGGERWGRYSFLSASARFHIRVYQEFVEIQNKGYVSKIPHNGKPFAVLRDFMSRFSPADMPELPRFWGGMVGYLAYEMVSFIEAVPNQWPEEKPLANFMVPDELLVFDNIRNTLLGIVIIFLDEDRENNQKTDRAVEPQKRAHSPLLAAGLASESKNSKHPYGRRFPAACGGELQKAFESARSRIRCMLQAIDRQLSENNNRACQGEYSLISTQEEDAYRSYVKRIKEYIRAGDVIQTVISQPFVCEAPPDLWMLYRAQRYINPSPYLYFMHIDDVALVGSSPETMVRLENGIATLRPIAGTRPRGKNEQEDRMLADELLGDEKELAEHLMLVDLGRNDLGRVAEVGTVQVTDLVVVERYSHVMHLVSNICCDLRSDCDAWDLLAATFPAGTLSGAPKVRAMEIIAELEKEPRGPYGGAVGYISFHGNMDMAITIRTACIENGQLTVRAGAGIVADSDPERERVETVNKAMAIQKALELLQGEKR
ncbi:MAG: anthranilate synthase component I family protein [Desulfobacterales bacterium]|nr:anthranilate synthase component I family protein [Desulfobacterales bacterium]